MTDTIECIFTGNVLKPIEPLHLKDGERVIVHIERKIPFNTIKLKTSLSREYVRTIRDESWMSL
ncbi:antitoxin family protein [Methanospirillum sp.]|uniref:antitoxin family protein n=1 Tax=Methanospirillum sp. TaxID=45200 RepID=UPI00345D5257